MSYKEDIQITEDLELELNDHAPRYLEYAEKFAAAQKAYKKAEDALKVVKASLYSQAKENWRSVWGYKPTETDIKSWVEVHPEVSAARKHLRECEYMYTIYADVKNAFQQRKGLLLSIVQMRLAGIYSTPKIKQKLHLDSKP